MSDMGAVIEPKSDQLNSDSLMAGPITIKIKSVSVRAGTEQPVSIFYEGDDGKPWKPCKSMARILVSAWGADSSKYVGKALTLYRDPKVKWGGLEVGGIRVSHMSDLEGPMTMALTETKQSRKPFTVRPLTVQKEVEKSHLPAFDTETLGAWADTLEHDIETATDARELHAHYTEAFKSAEGLAMKKADPDRAMALKAKATASINNLKDAAG